jgi:hypothetical protein
MRVCLLDSDTKKVINVVSLNSLEDHIPTPGVEVAPQHDGDIGWTWNGSGWDVPEIEITEEELIKIQRTKRNKMLVFNVDRINAVRWNSMTQEQRDAWTQYRQDLLDVPSQPGFPRNIIWPTKPE